LVQKEQPEEHEKKGRKALIQFSARRMQSNRYVVGKKRCK